MKLALFLLALPLFGQLAITGASSVQQNTTSMFSASGGTAPYTFSMIGGSAGSISSGGLYTAPASITPKSAPAGCQVLPNNHIFNTAMTSVPVDTRTNGSGTNNSVWMASYQAVFGGNPPNISYEIDFPINYIASSAPTTAMKFFFTGTTGNYTLPLFPNLRSENGYALYGSNVAGTDHHSLVEVTDLCQAQEIYQLHPTGFYPSCADCNSAGGQKYSLTDFAMNAEGADAAGMEMYPLSLKISELKAGAINHLVRVTMCPGCFDIASHQWPAQQNTAGTPNTAFMPYGTILRLKAGYTWPGYDGLCTTMLCQTYVQTLLTQLKTYGLIIADGGTTGAVSVMYDSAITPDILVSQDNTGAFGELRNILQLGSTNFDVINVSGLETSASGSGTDITWGEVKYNNGSVTPQDYAIVKVTDNVGATATKSVSLQGVAVGVPSRTEVFEAGTAATQMAAWVSGSSNTAYTCSLSPSGGDNGTVTSGCLYTPAATVSAKTKTVLTFTSTADGTRTATQDIVIFPAGNGVAVRFNDGDISDYTDGDANLWYADLKTGDPALWEDSFSYDYGMLAWVNAGQSPRVYDRRSGNGGDIYHNLHVPNGTYTLTLTFASDASAINQRNGSIDSQGNVNLARFDYFTAGGVQFGVFNEQYTVTVSSGTLQFVVRNLGTPPTFTDPCCNGTLYTPGFPALLSGFTLTQSGSAPTSSTVISGQVTISGSTSIQ